MPYRKDGSFYYSKQEIREATRSKFKEDRDTLRKQREAISVRTWYNPRTGKKEIL